MHEEGVFDPQAQAQAQAQAQESIRIEPQPQAQTQTQTQGTIRIGGGVGLEFLKPRLPSLLFCCVESLCLRWG